jgi:hypothetical protein
MKECGECSLCCTLLTVKDIDKSAGVVCNYCTEKCDIYETRPQGCRDFNCAYVQMDDVNIAMRPDKCGVVFEKINNTLVLGVLDPSRNTYPHLKGQVEAFYNEGANVVLLKNGQPRVFNHVGINPQNLIEEINNGCSSI